MGHGSARRPPGRVRGQYWSLLGDITAELSQAAWPLIVMSGIVVGILMGVFGVGGSSVATPLLSLLGVPPLVAVASPLAATIPAAIFGAGPYLRTGDARPRAAAWSLVGAVPATIIGALASRVIAGAALIIASGVVLVVVGIRVLLPIDDTGHDAGEARRRNRPLLVTAAAGVGLFTGVLANGGGFLLMPLYLLVFGLGMRQAVGTSLLVVALLSVPTLVTHWLLGHVDWVVAGYFAAGALPGSLVASRLAGRLAGPVQRRAFGWFLIVFGTLFTLSRVI